MSDRNYFKYIRSTEKDITGKAIYSGQMVSVHGRINKRQTVEVRFEPNHGFRIQGNNLVDAYDIEVEKDISHINKITGAIKFSLFTIFGYYKRKKYSIEALPCPKCDNTPVQLKYLSRSKSIQCRNVLCFTGEPTIQGIGNTKEEAVLSWNRQVEKYSCRQKELKHCMEM